LLDGETCLRCGREPVAVPAPGLPRRRRAQITWTQTRVIRAIRAFAFFRGRAPVLADWKRRMGDDWPPLETVEGLFGSLGEAVRAAGVEHPGSRSMGA
jgi:hypothetical protein